MGDEVEFLQTILARTKGPVAGGGDTEWVEGSDKKHQTSVHPFSLEVYFSDGLRKETFPWSMFGGHGFAVRDGIEMIFALFGGRLLIVRGYNLMTLDREMAAEKRGAIQQHFEPQVLQMLHNGSTEPIIKDIEVYPSWQEILQGLRGEERGNESSHARNVRGR